MTRLARILKTTDNPTAVAPPPTEDATIKSDFVVVLAALLCALISMMGLITMVRCAWLRRGSGSGSGGSPSYRSHPLANKGVKKKTLQSLPKFIYGDGTSNPAGEWKGSSDCAICWAEFAEGDEVRVLPQCGHRFHVGCIDRWLESHSSCPSCRQILGVARCQKCGRYPAMSAGGGPGEAVVDGTVSGTHLNNPCEDVRSGSNGAEMTQLNNEINHGNEEIGIPINNNNNSV